MGARLPVAVAHATACVMTLGSDLILSRRPMAGLLAVGFAWACFAAQVPDLKARIGASDAMFGTLTLIASMGALGAMWLAPLTHRIAGRWAVIVGAAAMAAGFVLAGAAAGPVVFTFGLFIAAAGSGVTDVLANARVSEIEAESGRRLMSLNHGLYSFGYAGSAVVTGWAREAGTDPVLVFSGLAVVIAGLCLVMRAPATMPGEATVDGPGAQAFPRMLVWIGGLIVMAAFLAEAASEGWSALHIERTLGGGPAEGALGPAILGFSMGVGRLAFHFMRLRQSDTTLIAIACVASAGGLAMAGAAPSIAVAYLGFAIGGLGVSVVVPLALALLGRIVPPEQRLAAISRASVIGYAAFFAGPPLMGYVAEFFGLRASFLTISAVLLMTAAVLVPALARQVQIRVA